LTGIRVSIVAPGPSQLPATAEIASLAAGETREVDLEISLGPAYEAPLADTVTLAASVSWKLALEVRSTSLLLEAAVEPDERASLGQLARIARQADPFVVEAIMALAPGERDLRIAGLIALDRLLRLADLRGPAAAATPALATVAATPRALLRELPVSTEGWNALAVAVLAAGGAPIGLLPAGGRTIVLTRLAAPSGIAVVPIVAATGSGLPGAVAEGTRLLAATGASLQEQAVSWIEPRPAPAAPSATTLPLILPALSWAPGRDTLLAAMLRAREP
jgi:hypothetical protein